MRDRLRNSVSEEEKKYAYETNKPRVEVFARRRRVLSDQVRYWAKLGHELPKQRNFQKASLD